MVIIKVSNDAGMEINNTPPFDDQSLLDSDHSSGYLEDALFEFKPKRRRLMMTPDDHHQPINYNSPPSFPSHWDFSTTDQDFENFGAFTGIQKFKRGSGATFWPFT
ncbi:putative protein XRI1 [Helianthus annuus]|nr:putative protein XRI1 [Helianthus annuus]